MKYFKTKGIYKNSTGSCTFNPDTHEGYSYDWYKVSGIKNDKLVVNTYVYSSTTVKHVYDIRSLLPCSPQLIIEAPEGLDNHRAIVRHYLQLNKELRAAIRKPRSHKAKNAERMALIKKHQDILAEVRQWGN